MLTKFLVVIKCGRAAIKVKWEVLVERSAGTPGEQLKISECF